MSWTYYRDSCGRVISKEWNASGDSSFIDPSLEHPADYPEFLENIEDTACEYSTPQRMQSFQTFGQEYGTERKPVRLPKWVPKVCPLVQLGCDIGSKIIIRSLYPFSEEGIKQDSVPVEFSAPEIMTLTSIPDVVNTPCGIMAVFGPFSSVRFEDGLPHSYRFGLTNTDIRNNVPDNWPWAFSVKGFVRMTPTHTKYMDQGNEITKPILWVQDRQHVMFMYDGDKTYMENFFAFYIDRDYIRFMRIGDFYLGLPLINYNGKTPKLPPIVMTVRDPFRRYER